MAQYKFARVIEWERSNGPKGTKSYGYRSEGIDEDGNILAHGTIPSDVISTLAKDNWTVVLDPTKGGLNPDIEYPDDVVKKAEQLLQTNPTDKVAGKGVVRRVMALKVAD
jgi:hypothetical protein